MHSLRHLTRLVAAAALVLAAQAAPAQTVDTAGVSVYPMARSAGFEFRLDKIAPSLYSASNPGPWMETGRRAMLEWRPAGSDGWKKAQDFVRVQVDRFHPNTTPDPRMATMLVGLKEGARYEYRVSFAGTGYPDKVFSGAFTTLTSAVPAGQGDVIPITVSEKSTSAEIMKALQAALSDDPAKNGGKVVEIRSAAGPGVPTVVRAALASAYAAGDWHWSGTSGQWLTLRMAKGHEVVFDGSDPAYDVTGKGMWTLVNDPALGLGPEDAVYVSKTSMPRPTAVFYERAAGQPGYRLLDITEREQWIDNIAGVGSSGIQPSRGASIVSAQRTEGSNVVALRVDKLPYLNPGDKFTVTGLPYAPWNGVQTVTASTRNDKDGVYEVRFQSSDDSSARSVTGGSITPLTPASTIKLRAAAGGECTVWVPDGPGAETGRLYIHLRNDNDPNAFRIKIPVQASALDITSAHNLVVSGLNLQYFGTAASGGFGGVGLITVSDLVFQDNTLTGLNGYIGNRSSYNSVKERIVIKGNAMRERGLGADPAGGAAPYWGWLKMSRQEGAGILLNGRSISLLDNHVEGMFNGVTYIGQASSDYEGTQTNYPEGYEIVGNDFVGIGDDAVEPEQWSVNYLVAENTFRGCYKGVSLAPLIGGPVYVLRNRWLGRGEYDGSGDWQSFLKMGNDDPGDTAYKLVANNSVVNVNANPAGEPLPGLMDSGAVYNHFYYNNYIASDGFSIAYGYGSLGFPHLFDYNRYVQGRPRDARLSSPGSFGFGKLAWLQGDQGDGSDHRRFVTFQDWQTGKASQNANMPGYTGTVPQAPVFATTRGSAIATSQEVVWLHDPHSTFQEGAHELADPVNGDFRPRSNAPVGGAGMRLANITFDCGPDWGRYEEAGNPTIGAFPGGMQVKPGNRSPAVSALDSVLGSVNRVVQVTVGYSDPDGDAVRVVCSVTDTAGVEVPSSVQDPGNGIATITFTPSAEGSYKVVSLVTDANGGSASATTTVRVLPEIPLGQDVLVQASVSRTDAKPGEPIVYTVVCTNPTDKAVIDARLRLPVPKGMQFYTASAMLDGKPVTATVTDGILQVGLGTVPAGVQQTLTVTALIQ